MESARESNPYLLLRLCTTASKQVVIERSRELSRETLDRGEQAKYRRAVEEICQHPIRRARCQFWEPSNTCYDDEVLQHFCDQYRTLPITVRMLEERRHQFIEEDCSPKNLVALAIPPIPFPSTITDFKLAGIPQAKLEMPLEPWELFT